MLAKTARQLTNENAKTASTVLVELFESIRYRTKNGDSRWSIDKYYSGLSLEEFDKLVTMLLELGYTVQPAVSRTGEVSTDYFVISW